jgi:hypothetical protein
MDWCERKGKYPLIPYTFLYPYIYFFFVEKKNEMSYSPQPITILFYPSQPFTLHNTLHLTTIIKIIRIVYIFVMINGNKVRCMYVFFVSDENDGRSHATLNEN